MDRCAFELVCDNCLATRDVLISEELPAQCPNCGAEKSWVGPVVGTRDFEGSKPESLPNSPFYLGAISGG